MTSTLGRVAASARPTELGSDEDCLPGGTCGRGEVSLVLRLLAKCGASRDTPMPRSAVRMFSAPPVTEEGRSKSKLPCFARLAHIDADADDSFVPELFLLLPLPVLLATLSTGTGVAPPILDSRSLSLSLNCGDPTRFGCVISISTRLRFSCLSTLSRILPNGVITRSLSFPFPELGIGGVIRGDGRPHKGEHRPSRSSSSGGAFSKSSNRYGGGGELRLVYVADRSGGTTRSGREG